MRLVRAVVLAAAVAAALAGPVLAPAAPDWRLVPAVIAVALARLLRVRFRERSGVFYALWGEAGLIAGLYLVPGGWLPLTYLAGSALAMTLRAATGQRTPPESALRNLTIATLAAAVGAGLSYAVADPYGGPVTLPVLGGLALGAVGYLLVTIGLTSVHVAVQDRIGVLALLRQALRHKRLMFAGNVAVGLLVVGAADLDLRWLIGLPLILTLLQATYAHRLRALEHRRMWRAFARAAQSLNQPDKADVAVAGARGALDVFAVRGVELELDTLDGGRRWTVNHTGEVMAGRVAAGAEPAVAAPAMPAGAVVRELAVTEPARPASPDGTPVPLQVAGARIGTLRLHFPGHAGPTPGEDGALQAYADALAAALHDTATHKELHELLARSAHDAQHDPLTGLLNRATLMARGETAVQLVAHARPVVLWLIDVDHFRETNDTLGHAAGDEVLRTTAARLRADTRPGELLARLGGDEFALLSTEPGAGHDDVLDLALRRGREIAECLAEPADIHGVELAIEASVGVVIAPAGTAEISELLRRADAALAEAKHGSDPVAWYDGDRDPGSTDRPALLAELRTALDRDDELVLMLQPVVRLDSGAPIGVEALVRWRHSRRGLLPPGEFLRMVENSDLIGMFTEYVLDQALAAATILAAAEDLSPDPAMPLPVAVNLSARSLLDPQLPLVVERLLRKHRLPGRRLTLEITESVMTREPPGINEALTDLRSLGVRLAVDDFGAGHASLTFLTRVAVDEVKIDPSLVAGMVESPQAAAIVRTTVSLGRDLGMRVVAEGVETAVQLDMLRGLGCEAAQGFHFAEPVPVQKAPGVLRSLGVPARSGPGLAPPRRLRRTDRAARSGDHR